MWFPEITLVLIFFLSAVVLLQPGGVLERGGHTEAAVDLAKLAGLSPVGVLCEITTKDGKDMARYVMSGHLSELVGSGWFWLVRVPLWPVSYR